MIKKLFNLIMILFVVGTSNAQNVKLNSVKIDWEDFYTLTTVDVNCDDFYHMFKKTLGSKTFDKKVEMAALREMAKGFSVIRNIKFIDVRGVIIFNYGSIKVKYCFDQFGTFSKGGTFYNNKRLKSFVENKLYPNGI